MIRVRAFRSVGIRSKANDRSNANNQTPFEGIRRIADHANELVIDKRDGISY
jgi:hypothetical protein